MREHEGRATRRASGTSAAPAIPTSRASPPTSASTRARRSTSRSTPPRSGRLPARHLPDGLLRRRRRPQGRDHPALGDACHRTSPPVTRAQRPAWSTAATGTCPPSWNSAGGRRLGHLLREARPRGRAGGGQPHRLHRPRRRRRLGPAVPDLRHDLAGLQPATAATASTSAGPARTPAAPTRSATTVRSHSRGPTPEDWVFNAEYPMVRWLERNGYDVSYFTGRRHRPPRSRDPRARVLPVGRPRRVLVRGPARQRGGRAGRRRQPRLLQRQRGVLEDALGEQHRRRHAYRTLVCYKETHAISRRREDRSDRRTWTGTWRDPRFSPPADGGRPENALTGTIFTVNSRHHRDQGAGGRRQDALLAEHERRQPAPGRDGHAARRARSATSGTRTWTTARDRPAWCACPRRPRTCRSGSSTTARTTAPARRPTI